jgi:hypothetical protein
MLNTTSSSRSSSSTEITAVPSLQSSSVRRRNNSTVTNPNPPTPENHPLTRLPRQHSQTSSIFSTAAQPSTKWYNPIGTHKKLDTAKKEYLAIFRQYKNKYIATLTPPTPEELQNIQQEHTLTKEDLHTYQGLYARNAMHSNCLNKNEKEKLKDIKNKIYAAFINNLKLSCDSNQDLANTKFCAMLKNLGFAHPDIEASSDLQKKAVCNLLSAAMNGDAGITRVIAHTAMYCSNPSLRNFLLGVGIQCDTAVIQKQNTEKHKHFGKLNLNLKTVGLIALGSVLAGLPSLGGVGIDFNIGGNSGGEDLLEFVANAATGGALTAGAATTGNAFRTNKENIAFIKTQIHSLQELLENPEQAIPEDKEGITRIDASITKQYARNNIEPLVAAMQQARNNNNRSNYSDDSYNYMTENYDVGGASADAPNYM